MKLPCHVLSVGQKMDFDTGDVISTVDVLLEDGTVVNATISADVSEHLIGLFAQTKTCATMRPNNDSYKVEEEYAELNSESYADLISVFGGSTGITETIPAEAPASPPSVAPRKEEWIANPSRRARTVPKDEAGNPIVPAVQNDPSGFSLRDGVDEDGVPSA